MRYCIWLLFLFVNTLGATPMHLEEPGLIDIHTHIGTFKGFDLSLQNLLTNLAQNHIQYALVSNIDGAALTGFTPDRDEVSINEEMARVVAQHPQLKALAWAKPGSPGASAANIEPFLRDRKFVGVKFHPDFNYFPADGLQVVPYLQLCQKYGVPAVFHCGRSVRSSATTIYNAAKKFPGVPCVLYHMGFGTDHSEAINVAAEAKLKGDARLFLEISQAGPQDILKAVQSVGAEHVLFGTDACYFGADHYAHYVPVIDALKRNLNQTDFRHIVHDNAISLFHLEETSGSSQH